MIVITIVSVAFLIAIVAAIRLNAAVNDAQTRFRVLAGGYGDAGMLIDARRRFRRRQESVEQAVDTGTVGLQSAHRTISGWFGKPPPGDGVYDNLRAFNRNIGRTVSGLFAPRPKKHSESLDEWRHDHGPQANRDRSRND